MSGAVTWVLLYRDVSDSVRVQGQRAATLAVLLDAANGLVVSSHVGTSRQGVVDRAVKDAVIRPAAPLAKLVPARIVCAPDLIDAASVATAKLSKLADTSIEEGVELWEAEEAVDSLVGHLEGRDQPPDPPSVDDWRTLYGTLEAFVVAVPWERWSDSDRFTMRLEVGDLTVDRTGIVLGAAGIQHGFNLTADPDALHRAATGASDARQAMEGALIVHLDPWREVGGVFADKAERYGWPASAVLVPQMYTVRRGEPADLDVTDATLLALSLTAVVACDASQQDTPAPTKSGRISFHDTVGSYTVQCP